MNIHYQQCPICEGQVLETILTAKDHTVSQESFPIVECQDCTFTFTQDVPNEEHIGPYYQSDSYISHSNTKTGLINKAYHFARDFMLSSKKRLVEKNAPKNVVGTQKGKLLDIGSGTGYFLNIMKQANWQVQGIEPDSGARSFSRKEFDLEVQELDQLFELSDQSFDVITMWHVLEHVHRLDETLDKIHKTLVKNGLLVIAVPNCNSADAKHYGPHWAGWDVPRHLYHFTPKTMDLLAKKHQFKIKSKKLMPFDPFYIALLSEKYKNGKGNLLGGGLTGGTALLKATTNVNVSSSVIYVLNKDN